MRRRALLLAPLAIAIAKRAGAKDFAAGSIHIIHPWAAPSATEAAAMFVGLRNDGPRPDRLIAASTTVAGSVVFHGSDGTPLDAFELLPRRLIRLRPGRRYIALGDLTRPLALDDVFPLTLRFAEAGSITIGVTVEAGSEDDV